MARAKCLDVFIRSLVAAALVTTVVALTGVRAYAEDVKPVVTEQPAAQKDSEAEAVPESKDDYMTGFMLRGYYSGQYMHNDFNGRRVLASTDATIDVPRLGHADGWGLAVEGKSKWFGVQLAYGHGRHSGDFFGTTYHAGQHMLNVDVKVYLPLLKVVQPYVLGGGGLYWLNVRRSAVDNFTGEVRDANYFNWGWNYGLGVSIFPVKHIVVFGEVVWNDINYKWVNVPHVDTFELSRRLDSDFVSYNFGVGLMF